MDHLLTPAPPSAEDVEAALATLERAAGATPPDGALVLARRAVESCAARAAASGPLRAAAREKAHEVVRATVRLLGLFDGQSLELARTTAERRMKPSRPRTDAERATALSARLAPGAGAFLRGLPAPCLLASLSAGGARELATLAQTGRSFAAGDGRALLREAIVELCARAFPGRRVPTRRRPADAPPSPPSSLARVATSRRARAPRRLRASRGARGENAQPPSLAAPYRPRAARRLASRANAAASSPNARARRHVADHEPLAGPFLLLRDAARAAAAWGGGDRIFPDTRLTPDGAPTALLLARWPLAQPPRANRVVTVVGAVRPCARAPPPPRARRARARALSVFCRG